MEPRRTRFYRDKVNGKLGGVCAGIADYFNIEVLWVRLGFVMATIFGGGFPIPLYLAMWWLAGRKPASLYDANPEERKFWSTVRVAPQRSIRDVHSRFREIDRRLRDIEAHAVSANTRLAAEIDGLR